MPPRQISNRLLIIVWLTSLIPYLVIKLWLVRIPSWFQGADVIAEITSNALLAFFTAFPFWWLIEWFQHRKRRHEVARIQRRYVDEVTIGYNILVEKALIPSGERPQTPIPDHHIKTDVGQVVMEFSARALSDQHFARMVNESLLAQVKDFEISNLKYEAYKEWFSIQFNEITFSLPLFLRQELELARQMLTDPYDEEDDSREEPVLKVSSSLHTMGSFLRNLELTYRKDNGIRK